MWQDKKALTCDFFYSIETSLYSFMFGKVEGWYSWKVTNFSQWLKGKFSSGREGALASKFNYNFK